MKNLAEGKLIKISPTITKEMTFDEVLKQYKNYLHKECNQFRNQLDCDDAFQIASMGLFKAYKSYKDINITMMTYAARVIRNEFLMAIRKNKNQIKTESLNNVMYGGQASEITLEQMIIDTNINIEEQVEERLILKKAFKGLNNKEKKIIVDCFIRNKSQSEISKQLNISQSYVSRIVSNTLIKMRKNLDKKEETKEMGKSTADPQEIINLYKEGTSVYAIGRKLNCGPPMVKKVLKENGLLKIEEPKEIKEVVEKEPKINNPIKMNNSELEYIAIQLSHEELRGYIKGNVINLLSVDMVKAEQYLHWYNSRKEIKCS